MAEKRGKVRHKGHFPVFTRTMMLPRKKRGKEEEEILWSNPLETF